VTNDPRCGLADVEGGFGTAAGGLTQCMAVQLIAGNGKDGPGERARIIRGDEKGRSCAFGKDLASAADIGGDDREAARGRFEQYATKGFLPSGMHQQIALGEDFGDIAAAAQKMNASCERRRCGGGLQKLFIVERFLLARRPLANDQPMENRRETGDMSGCLQGNVNAFTKAELPDDYREASLGRKVQLSMQEPSWRARAKLFDVDAVVGHGAFASVDAQGNMKVAGRVRNREQALVQVDIDDRLQAKMDNIAQMTDARYAQAGYHWAGDPRRGQAIGVYQVRTHSSQ
jgi:hypothetical protein